ncbi:hypothetical protein AUEXF2481DRAFT_372907 [Aureobasidium subglaciale EXF-2481]|uniref:Uncharacterized protein n=1 Tax=Aureobasidium subglaciale (strain EXF-2481) TaxID=1043005 RepID=A0A074YX35_AURSE|nr:uncharacterized protein AUEXF2481DRAFT_372907 [Aureobasidium subglaciale EXF-2481]KEQ98732.1 hypothetical protein AUEXF2481DRAFT_372907 [Aureobasidium subglaciale EXF-2481]
MNGHHHRQPATPPLGFDLHPRAPNHGSARPALPLAKLCEKSLKRREARRNMDRGIRFVWESRSTRHAHVIFDIDDAKLHL